MSTAIYGVPYCARDMCAITSDDDHCRFVVGTTQSRKTNELHAIDIVEDHLEGIRVECVQIYKIADEIWSLSPCPSRQELIGIGINDSNGQQVVRICTMGALYDEQSTNAQAEPTLDVRTTIKIPERKVQRLFWDPTGFTGHVCTSDNEGFRIWDLEKNMETAKMRRLEGISDLPTFDGLKTHHFDGNCLSWCPNASLKIGVGIRNQMWQWDGRQKAAEKMIDRAAIGDISDVQYHPTEEYTIAIGSHCGRVKVFDLRNPKAPTFAVQNHAHWVTGVRFHPSQPSLLLTCSTDSLVLLHNLSTGNSEPFDRFDTHEDSVYAVTWGNLSHSLPFLWGKYPFASLSWDGRVAVHTLNAEALRDM